MMNPACDAHTLRAFAFRKRRHGRRRWLARPWARCSSKLPAWDQRMTSSRRRRRISCGERRTSAREPRSRPTCTGFAYRRRSFAPTRHPLRMTGGKAREFCTAAQDDRLGSARTSAHTLIRGRLLVQLIRLQPLHRSKVASQVVQVLLVNPQNAFARNQRSRPCRLVHSRGLRFEGQRNRSLWRDVGEDRVAWFEFALEELHGQGVDDQAL